MASGGGAGAGALGAEAEAPLPPLLPLEAAGLLRTHGAGRGGRGARAPAPLGVRGSAEAGSGKAGAKEVAEAVAALAAPAAS